MQEFLQPLLPEEERHYLILSRQGDMNARNLLVEHNLRLVAHIVKKYHNLDREKEDMISIGVIGLIKAINTYDISKGHRLVLGTQETDLIKKIEQKENIKRIYEELEKMEMNKEKKTLIMRYGLYGREPMTQKEVAKKLHISRSYVSRIEKKALMLLKSKIKT